jgi:hypothetical protein
MPGARDLSMPSSQAAAPVPCPPATSTGTSRSKNYQATNPASQIAQDIPSTA